MRAEVIKIIIKKKKFGHVFTVNLNWHAEKKSIYLPFMSRNELDKISVFPDINGTVAATRVAKFGRLAERNAHHVVDGRKLAEQAPIGRESGAHLIPEFNMLYTHCDQFVAGCVRIPFYAEDLLLVSSRCSQLFAFAPVPNTNAMIVVQADRSQLLAITREAQGADASLVLALQYGQGLHCLNVPDVNGRITTYLACGHEIPDRMQGQR